MARVATSASAMLSTVHLPCRSARSPFGTAWQPENTPTTPALYWGRGNGLETGPVTVYFTFVCCNISNRNEGETGTVTVYFTFLVETINGKRGQSPFISLLCVVIFLRTHLAEHFLFQNKRGQSPFISLLCVVIMFDLRNRTLEPQDVTLGQKSA